MSKLDELKKVIKVFSKSPHILTSKGFSTDPFVLMSQIYEAEGGTDTVKLLYKSSKDLFKMFGCNAKIYFKFLKILLDSVQEREDPREYKAEIEKFISSVSFHIEAIKSYEELRKYFSDLAVSSVEEADGGYLTIVPDDETDIESEDSIFEIGTSFVGDLLLQDVTIVVLPDVNKDTIINSVQNSYEQGKPLVMIFNDESKFASEFAEKNKQKHIYFVRVRPVDVQQDFYLDLTAFLNAVPSTKYITNETCGHASEVRISDNRLYLKSKKSILRTRRVHQIEAEILQEKSPMRKEVLKKRMANLTYSKTTLKISANSEAERKSLITNIASEIVEISNAIRKGIVVKNTLGDEFNGVSAPAFSYILVKAAEDVVMFNDSLTVKQ